MGVASGPEIFSWEVGNYDNPKRFLEPEVTAKYHCKILTAGNQAESNKSNLASNDCSKNMSTVLALPSTSKIPH